MVEVVLGFVFQLSSWYTTEVVGISLSRRTKYSSIALFAPMSISLFRICPKRRHQLTWKDIKSGYSSNSSSSIKIVGEIVNVVRNLGARVFS